jgi:hypothetical protein
LPNLLKVAKRHGFKPRNATGGKEQIKDIKYSDSQSNWSQRYIYISYDSTSAKVKEREEEHIKASQPGNIIATSYYRIPKVIRSTS